MESFLSVLGSCVSTLSWALSQTFINYKLRCQEAGDNFYWWLHIQHISILFLTYTLWKTKIGAIAINMFSMSEFSFPWALPYQLSYMVGLSVNLTTSFWKCFLVQTTVSFQLQFSQRMPGGGGWRQCFTVEPCLALNSWAHTSPQPDPFVMLRNIPGIEKIATSLYFGPWQLCFCPSLFLSILY